MWPTRHKKAPANARTIDKRKRPVSRPLSMLWRGFAPRMVGVLRLFLLSIQRRAVAPEGENWFWLTHRFLTRFFYQVSTSYPNQPTSTDCSAVASL